jgi:hypothetical protein
VKILEGRDVFKTKYLKVVILLQFIISLLFLGVISVSANTVGDWFDKISEIRLGSTTRKGIEKLFEIENAPKENVSFEQIEVSYGVGNGFLSVIYASGKGCSKITNMGYKLDKDIVVSYFYVPGNEIKVSRLGINLSDISFSESDDENNRNYGNPKNGKYYLIENKSLITYVWQTFTKEQLRKYSCEHYIKIY